MTDEYDPKELKRRLKEEKKRLKELKKKQREEMKRRKQELKLARIEAQKRKLTGGSAPQPTPEEPKKEDVLPNVPAEPTEKAPTQEIPPDAVWVKRSRLSIEEIEARVDALDLDKLVGLENRLDTEHKTLFELYATKYGEELPIPEEFKDSTLLDIPVSDGEVEIKVSGEEGTPEEPKSEGGGVFEKIKSVFSRKKEE